MKKVRSQYEGKLTPILMDGVHKLLDEDGEVATIFSIKGGKFDGVRENYVRGELSSVIPYVDGRIHGQAIGYESDETHWEYPFEHGQLHGTQRQLDENDQVLVEREWYKGSQTGESAAWANDGRLLERVTVGLFDEFAAIVESFHKSGHHFSVSLYGHFGLARYLEYDQDGTLVSDTIYGPEHGDLGLESDGPEFVCVSDSGEVKSLEEMRQDFELIEYAVTRKVAHPVNVRLKALSKILPELKEYGQRTLKEYSVLPMRQSGAMSYRR